MKSLIFILAMMLTGVDVGAQPFEMGVVNEQEYTIYFNTGSVVLPPGEIKKLPTQLSNKDVQITGYASSEGSTDYNIQLSHRRAEYVYSLLGVSHASVDAVGESEASDFANPKDRKVIVTATDIDVVYNPIFGGYSYLTGPISHLQHYTIPK